MPPESAHRSPAADFREAAAYLARRASQGAALPPEDARRVCGAAAVGFRPLIGPLPEGSVAEWIALPLPTVRHDPAPTGDAGEPEKAR